MVCRVLPEGQSIKPGASQMRRKDEMDMQAANKPQDRSKKGSPAGAHKALIARNLRLVLGDTASEPIPKEWLHLLEQLDAPKGDKQ